MLIKLNSKSIIYVVCPPNFKTGGTELAHQLVWMLNAHNKKAFICYSTENRSVQICEEFRKYCSEFTVLSEVEDNEDNLIIFPEISTPLVKRYNNIRKAIWWMSVNNYTKNTYIQSAFKEFGTKGAIKLIIKKIFRIGTQNLSMRELKNVDLHFVQSEYAKDFLARYNLKGEYLTDYINECYYDIDLDMLKKEDFVVYNPKKGFAITKKLIEQNPDIKWIPLINMSNEQMKETLKSAKVYIDFGNFPGKDRIPREAALSYCCVITGMKGAAGFEKDLPIQKKYKFKDPLNELSGISKLIRECFEKYDENIKDFEYYRQAVLSEKETFEQEVVNLFCSN